MGTVRRLRSQSHILEVHITDTASRLVYAQNIAKITNRQRITSHIPGSEDMTLTKLDIYVGYTEDIIKICARIADLPSLVQDPVAFGEEIHTV